MPFYLYMQYFLKYPVFRITMSDKMLSHRDRLNKKYETSRYIMRSKRSTAVVYFQSYLYAWHVPWARCNVQHTVFISCAIQLRNKFYSLVRGVYGKTKYIHMFTYNKMYGFRLFLVRVFKLLRITLLFKFI